MNQKNYESEKFVKNKKLDFSIPKLVELKSINKYGRLFIEKINGDSEYDKLDIYTFGFEFENYFIESSDGYINLLLDVLIKILNFLKIKKGDKVNIFHDNINAKDNNKVEKKIDGILNEIFGIKSSFKIHNSKKYLGLQLADLIVGKYKEYYFFDDIKKLEEFIFYKDYAN